MPAKRLSEVTSRKILDIWGSDPTLRGKEVHARVTDQGLEVGLRKVQQIIADLKEQGHGKFQPTDWVPWSDPGESSDDSKRLIELQYQWKKEFGRGLYAHEARWARRLGPSLEGSWPWLKFTLVGEYSEREMVSANLGETISTSDLDPILAFAPWKSKSAWESYSSAVGFGLAEAPNIVVEDHDGDAVFAVFGRDAILLCASQAKRDGDLIDLPSIGFAETIKVSQSTGFVELSTGPARGARLRASLRERMVNYIFGEGEYPEPQPNDLVYAIRVESGVSQ